MGGRPQGALPDFPPFRRRGRAAHCSERDSPVPDLSGGVVGDADEGRFWRHPFLWGFRAVRIFPRIRGGGVPGEERVTRRAGDRRFPRIMAAGIVLVASLAMATAVMAADRYQ